MRQSERQKAKLYPIIREDYNTLFYQYQILSVQNNIYVKKLKELGVDIDALLKEEVDKMKEQKDTPADPNKEVLPSIPSAVHTELNIDNGE